MNLPKSYPHGTPRALRFSRSEDVATEAVQDEMLLVQLANGAAFRLNRTGRAVWELLGTGGGAVEIAERLSGTLGAPRDRLERDVTSFLEELAANQLLEVARGGDR